jgi:3-oxoacyl-[acyl-carrier-protein] synthase II
MRHRLFALAAAAAALADAGLEPRGERSRMGISISSSKGAIGGLEDLCRHLPGRAGPGSVDVDGFTAFAGNGAAQAVAEALGGGMAVSTPVAACATGAHALLSGFRMIISGYADLVLAGATESCFTPLMLSGYRRMGVLAFEGDGPAAACRPFDLHRTGFIPGEGCGIVLLETETHARRRGAAPYAVFKGGAVGIDTFHMTAPTPSGEPLADLIGRALEYTQLTPDSVDYINAHGTATRVNDPVETAAIRKAFGASTAVSISSTKPLTGHLLGAAGAVECIIAVLALRHGVIPPTINLTSPDPRCDLDYTPCKARTRTVRNALSISCGFGGHMGVVIVGAPEGDTLCLNRT